MKQFIEKYISSNLLGLLRKNYIKYIIRNYKKSYSQSGEDMILSTILNSVKKGFYVDVGANNPKIQSNTHFFYLKGWSGINIDALPGSMVEFSRKRPRDINLEFPVSDNQETLTFYMFSPSFYNSFDKNQAHDHKDKLIGTRNLRTKTLAEILDEYMPDKAIDFLTVDVEGYDFQVLKSNNWKKYRPKIVLIELFAKHLVSKSSIKITDYMEENGYVRYCQTPTNAFFLEVEFLKTRFGKI